MSQSDEAARVPRPGQGGVFSRIIAASASVTYTVPAEWKGAYITISSDCSYRCTSFTHVPHPASRPMQYSPFNFLGL